MFSIENTMTDKIIKYFKDVSPERLMRDLEKANYSVLKNVHTYTLAPSFVYARIKRNSTPEYKKTYYAYGRKYIARHKEETCRYKKEYREKNKDKLKNQQREWYLRNRARILIERKKAYDAKK